MSDALAHLSPVKHDAADCRLEQLPLERTRQRTAAGWCAVALFWLAAIGCIGLAASNFRRVALAADHLEELCRQAPGNQTGRGACAGFARTQPPVMFDPDSECWIDLTQKQYRDGTIRPHDDFFDNTPYGRERQWSSSFSWWLLLLAGLAHALGGMPMVPAIAQVAPYANPVLFAGFVTTLAVVLRRRMGGWAAGMFILTLTALSGVEWDFSSGHPDHHGLHLMAFSGLFLGALLAGLGWVRVGGPGADAAEREDISARWLCLNAARARRWFTVSGVCGGIGLWIGSTQQIVCIGALGAGAVLAALCFASRWEEGEQSRFEPALWRHWSRAGALTSLVFYLVEYFPGHLEMRLEVNHPLIALAWASAGELMWVITMAKVAGTRVGQRTLWARAFLGLLGLAALPLAILCGPRAWFVLRDPMLAWSTRVISEGQPWLDLRHPVAALLHLWNGTGVLMLAVPLAAGVLVWRRRLEPWRRGSLLTLLLATVVFLAWTQLQNRWLGFLEISLLMLTLATVFCLPIRHEAGGARRPLLLLLAFLLPVWLGFAVLQVRTREENPARHAAALLKSMMALKETAWNLKLYAGSGRPARVMAPPGDSPTFHYYGGVETVGSYYWENLAGAHAALDFYNDSGDVVARRIVRERGLDFVVAVAQPSFVLEMQMLQTGRVNVVAARRTLAFRLSSPSAAEVPVWLERLPLLDAPVAEADGIRIYRVRRDRL